MTADPTGPSTPDAAGDPAAEGELDPAVVPGDPPRTAEAAAGDELDPAAVPGGPPRTAEAAAAGEPAFVSEVDASEWTETGEQPDVSEVDASGQAAPAEVARLRAAVSGLDELAALPVAEHVARYDALHSELSDAFAAIDEV